MVVQGAGQTGMWEDMAGKQGDIRLVRDLRRSIVLHAPNSGAAKQAWIDRKEIDAWIIYNIWQVANPTLADLVPVSKEFGDLPLLGGRADAEGNRAGAGEGVRRIPPVPGGSRHLPQVGLDDAVTGAGSGSRAGSLPAPDHARRGRGTRIGPVGRVGAPPRRAQVERESGAEPLLEAQADAQRGGRRLVGLEDGSRCRSSRPLVAGQGSGAGRGEGRDLPVEREVAALDEGRDRQAQVSRARRDSTSAKTRSKLAPYTGSFAVRRTWA